MRSFAIAVAALVIFSAAAPARAQSARAQGTVRDMNGRPLKGATVRATNPDAYPPEFAAVTDEKGRWAMIGLRTGTWSFRVEAEGFSTVEASAPVRVAVTPPMVFTLARDPGPIPDALSRDIQQQLTAAHAHRDAGRLEEALSAYRNIQARNPKLTTIHLALADVYRKKAVAEQDPAERRRLLDLAIASYSELLESDGSHERAKVELESTRTEAARGR